MYEDLRFTFCSRLYICYKAFALKGKLVQSPFRFTLLLALYPIFPLCRDLQVAWAEMLLQTFVRSRPIGGLLFPYHQRSSQNCAFSLAAELPCLNLACSSPGASLAALFFFFENLVAPPQKTLGNTVSPLFVLLQLLLCRCSCLIVRTPHLNLQHHSIWSFCVISTNRTHRVLRL